MSKSAAITTTNHTAAARNPFGLPLISMLKTAMKAYPGKFNPAERSVKMLEVTVPIESCGAMVTATVYGRLVPNSAGHTISYEASVPRGVHFESDEQRTAFLAHAEIAASRSSAWEKLMAQADAALLGIDAPVSENAVARPRLVRTVKPATVAVETTA
jgi:hypothetical protein